MIVTLALRSLLSRPVRSAVLAGGFGLGVAVMAALLGVGEVILDQARAPALVGGGDVVVGGATGRVTSARFVLSDVLGTGRSAIGSPSRRRRSRANLYLDRRRGATPVRARGGIPSLERALGDPETSGVSRRGPTRRPIARGHRRIRRTCCARWIAFIPIPDVPARAESWAEWLYFNGRAGATRFYLTFLAGPRLAVGGAALGVRLQLERGGTLTSYSDAAEVDDATAAGDRAGPDRRAEQRALDGSEYRITIDLAGRVRRPRAARRRSSSARCRADRCRRSRCAAPAAGCPATSCR